jgi:hypothetical protein
MYYNSYSNLEPGMVVGAIIFGLIVYAVTAFLLSTVFAKAGVEKWKAWVPVYNNWTFLELGGQKGYWALLPILSGIPILGIAASIAAIVFLSYAAYNIGSHVNKASAGWVVLFILVSPVWFGIVGLDKEQWDSRPLTGSGNVPTI